MVARPILAIPKDQPDFGDGRDYAPGHVEIFEARTGEVIGRYDPMTQPITVLMELVYRACDECRWPDWATLPTCSIPEDLQAHVYAIDYRGFAWSDEDDFPEAVHVDELRARLATLSPEEEEEFPRLTLDDAIVLPEAELRRRYQQVLIELTDYPTKKEFPADFPWDEAQLTRDELLRNAQLYAYWFDPDRGHPRPSRQQLRTHDSRQREFWAAAGTVPRLDS